MILSNQAMASKKKAQQIHFSRRAIQRHGITAGENTQSEIIKQIQSGKATFIKRQSLRVTIWEVEVRGQKIKAVYDKDRKQVVTTW
jgi:hypothetical protein